MVALIGLEEKTSAGWKQTTLYRVEGERRRQRSRSKILSRYWKWVRRQKMVNEGLAGRLIVYWSTINSSRFVLSSVISCSLNKVGQEEEYHCERNWWETSSTFHRDTRGAIRRPFRCCLGAASGHLQDAHPNACILRLDVDHPPDVYPNMRVWHAAWGCTKQQKDHPKKVLAF